MSKKLKVAIIIVFSVLIVIALLTIWFLSTFKYEYDPITEEPKELGFEEVEDEKVINIALFGVDSRYGSGDAAFSGNSDSIMVLSVNTSTKKIKIISLMRDTLVPIERSSGLTYYKLNAAYSWGGPELAIKTINQNFGLDISEYATVNFYGMATIIDSVGGIDATLTESEVAISGDNNHGINDYIDEICYYKGLSASDYEIHTAGYQHLNGIQAVAYTRIRYCENVFGTNFDYGRTDRQRYVIEQLFAKAKSLPKSDYPNFIKQTLPYVKTSLSYTEILDIALKTMFSSPTFEQYRIPQNSAEMNFLMTAPKGKFGSVVYYDLGYASRVIHAVIYDNYTIEQFVAENPIEKNDWYANR